MKLDELREALRREREADKPAPGPWEVRRAQLYRPLGLQRRPCPKCGGKRRLIARVGDYVEVECARCRIRWQASHYMCRICDKCPVSAGDRVCPECMGVAFPPMHHRCRSGIAKKVLR